MSILSTVLLSSVAFFFKRPLSGLGILFFLPFLGFLYLFEYGFFHAFLVDLHLRGLLPLGHRLFGLSHLMIDVAQMVPYGGIIRYELGRPLDLLDEFSQLM